MPIFKRNHRIVYFTHIPKTGGSSIENAMKGCGVKVAMLMSKKKNTFLGFSKCTPQHIHADIVKQYFGEGFFDWQFSVVRNPFARIASEYKMKADLSEKRVPPDEWIVQALERYSNFPFTRDNHIRPQHQFLSAEVEVFHLENGLQKPLDTLCEVLEIPMISVVPHSRKSEPQALNISKKTLTAIVKFYKEDFDMLGYSDSNYSDYFRIQEKSNWSIQRIFRSDK